MDPKLKFSEFIPAIWFTKCLPKVITALFITEKNFKTALSEGVVTEILALLYNGIFGNF